MDDPYRIGPQEQRRPASRRNGWALRALLWAILVIAVSVNIVAGTIGRGSLLVGFPSGLVAVACITGLIVHHVRSGRR
ncbi:hypothetical protein FE391_42840 [Nonomuraea sp. KC401]|uniref:Uncharacterized protein n=1 Tax=Nonomuraea longispora TaxID=1848320 RepID=A0A4R4MQP7_9ACTN|nr:MULTISPECIES: hypothetical protein [Nonomuraea]NBE98979.1 hypothetical protein [Nonomuraea sp. K271]TDB97403.1 hypothetical protein E1267_39885 [Nonomuraea longispora]TLF53542.1 hypothetical protein FE391_42840 [Nonomuraea sp. KC401]